jgi:CubicO group peptidase (beta-lactamase class C family)
MHVRFPRLQLLCAARWLAQANRVAYLFVEALLSSTRATGETHGAEDSESDRLEREDMKPTLTSALAVMLGTAGCSAGVVPGAIVDEATAERIAVALDDMIADGEAAGVSVLIHERGEEAFFGAAGMADGETGLPMGRDIVVQIFSMTKPITAVAFLMLHEQGLFDLDDPLAEYAPEFADMRVYAGTDENGEPVYEAPRRPITIRDLTRHTAGFVNRGDEGHAGDAWREAAPMDFANTLPEFARLLASVPLAYHPGEEWRYSDAMDVQAFLVERLSGMPFDEFLQQRIFEPLGMTQTGYTLLDDQYERVARMYVRGDDSVLTPEPDEGFLYLNRQPHALKAGGYGLVSTLDDYMRFARMLLNEGELDGVRVLEAETVRLMATDHLADEVTERSWLPSKGQVGFGINVAVRVAPPASADENSGAVGEFFWDGAASTLFWVDPANDLAAVFFTQHRPFNGELHKRIRDAVYGPP